MRIIKWMAVAFSMYSRIPMPVFEWKEEDMSGGLMFFPVVGMVIGAISAAVAYMALSLEWPVIVTILLLGLILVVITGGFHIDGYMDMTDALRSYQPMEKKLEILKDPHIGAFAVIGMLGIMLTYGIGLSFLTDRWNMRSLISYGIIFVLSRAVSGISSVTMKKAKKNGMLYEETKSRNKPVIVVLSVQLLIASGILVYINWATAIILLITLLVISAYYRHTVYRQFGGVTGDTAGYLVTISETAMTVVLGIATWYGI